MEAAPAQAESARQSHDDFLNERNWGQIEGLWASLLASPDASLLPSIVRGDEQYGLTSLAAINCAGQGSQYTGYQQQRGVEGIRTVEDDLDSVLGRKVVAAGRTDKGVSALSQVVSYTTFDEVSPPDILLKIRDSEPCRSGRLSVWDCRRVPRKFHPLFGATWRRYIYFFPLQPGAFGAEHSDVDVVFVNDALSRLVGQNLPYNGFAHRENRATGEGQSDICILHRAQATVCSVESLGIEGGSGHVMVVELVGDRFLRRMVRILVATVVRESVLPETSRNVNLLVEIAQSRDRSRAAAAAPSAGLGLCGVGYDLEDLADFRGRNKKVVTATTTSEYAVDSSTVGDTTGTKRKRTKPFESSKRNKSAAVGYASASNLAELRIPEEVATVTTVDAHNWSPFQSELVCCNGDLLFYPQRRFKFDGLSLRAGASDEIVLEQSVADVGTTVWDAEVLLSHYLDKWIIQESSFPMHRVLELGAGCALAGQVCERHGTPHVVAQETPSVAPSLRVQLQTVGSRVSVAEGMWGADLVAQLNADVESGPVDCIIAADVLYHSEDLSPLRSTIVSLLRNVESGHLILAFEQRRRDLSGYITALARCFRHRWIYRYDIESSTAATESGDQEDAAHRSATFYMCHFTGIVHESEHADTGSI